MDAVIDVPVVARFRLSLAERLVDVTAAASRSEAALRDNQVELELLRNLEKNPPGTQKELIGHFFSRAQSSPSN